MKRDDEFSRGLAGFIEETAKGAKHADLTKREKVNQLKSMIKIALDEVDGKTYGDRIEKDAKKGIDYVVFGKIWFLHSVAISLVLYFYLITISGTHRLTRTHHAND